MLKGFICTKWNMKDEYHTFAIFEGWKYTISFNYKSLNIYFYIISLNDYFDIHGESWSFLFNKNLAMVIFWDRGSMTTNS
jgi:hypothetical protein